jgi:hypothetical protein
MNSLLFSLILTVQPISVDVSTTKSWAAMTQAQAYFAAVGIEVKFLPLKFAKNHPETPEQWGNQQANYLYLTNASWIEISQLLPISIRGEAREHAAWVRLGPWVGVNSRLIAHEISHLLGAKHSWRGVTCSNVYNFLIAPLWCEDFATGFGEETVREMH